MIELQDQQPLIQIDTIGMEEVAERSTVTITKILVDRHGHVIVHVLTDMHLLIMIQIMNQQLGVFALVNNIKKKNAY